jgi:hypothetical protein
MQSYRRKEHTEVTAVCLNLDTDGFTYRKWGAMQRAKPGDWLVNKGDDVYTVDAETFERTYRRLSPGLYEKTSQVWARRAEMAGVIPTREGSTAYKAGDYLVFNDPEEKDGYAISASKFESLYVAESVA